MKNTGSSITLKSDGDVVIHANNIARIDANNGVMLGASGGYVVTASIPGEMVFEEGYILTAQEKIRG